MNAWRMVTICILASWTSTDHQYNRLNRQQQQLRRWPPFSSPSVIPSSKPSALPTYQPTASPSKAPSTLSSRTFPVRMAIPTRQTVQLGNASPHQTQVEQTKPQMEVGLEWKKAALGSCATWWRLLATTRLYRENRIFSMVLSSLSRSHRISP
jgi:hypothetical protein